MQKKTEHISHKSETDQRSNDVMVVKVNTTTFLRRSAYHRLPTNLNFTNRCTSAESHVDGK